MDEDLADLDREMLVAPEHAPQIAPLASAAGVAADGVRELNSLGYGAPVIALAVIGKSSLGQLALSRSAESGADHRRAS